MTVSTGRSSSQLLDAVQSLGQLDAFHADAYVGRLGDELAGRPVTLAALEACDDSLRTALAAIDGFATRSMRIRLDHLLAGDHAVAPPFRKVLASTVVGYGSDLELMRERVESAAARVDPYRAADLAAAVVATARRVLEVRAELRDGVLELTAVLAAAHVATARHAARDRASDDGIRLRWTAARRDLELIVERPERIAEARFADRVRTLVVPDEPPGEAPELTRGELIELD